MGAPVTGGGHRAAMTGRGGRMSPTEGPTGGASAQQRIIRATQQLRHLVQALADGQDADFRAIHEVASRIMEAAYDGWKTAELAKIAPPRLDPPP
jgi:hypothetical protein